jgi:hypothetical protein
MAFGIDELQSQIGLGIKTLVSSLFSNVEGLSEPAGQDDVSAMNDIEEVDDTSDQIKAKESKDSSSSSTGVYISLIFGFAIFAVALYFGTKRNEKKPEAKTNTLAYREPQHKPPALEPSLRAALEKQVELGLAVQGKPVEKAEFHFNFGGSASQGDPERIKSLGHMIQKFGSSTSTPKYKTPVSGVRKPGHI